jgi:hypothetical protein
MMRWLARGCARLWAATRGSAAAWRGRCSLTDTKMSPNLHLPEVIAAKEAIADSRALIDNVRRLSSACARAQCTSMLTSKSERRWKLCAASRRCYHEIDQRFCGLSH